MEIPEREFLWAGGFWMALALLAGLPWIGPSWLGQLARVIAVVAGLVHVGEAFYARATAQRAGLDPETWFWRSLVMGYLAVRKLHPASPS
jgi:Transmembrane protein 254